jgi:hypothetical protein
MAKGKELMVICPHTSWSGAERPIAEMGRWPILWQCDQCSKVALEVEVVI